jgi:hypothetical protein
MSNLFLDKEVNWPELLELADRLVRFCLIRKFFFDLMEEDVGIFLRFPVLAWQR